MALDPTFGIVRTTAAGDRTMSLELGPAYVSVDIRDYLRILSRRRRVLIYTFLAVIVLSLLTIGYQTFNSAYLQQIGVVVKQDPPSPQVVPGGTPQLQTYNPQAAQRDNTAAVVGALHAMATRRLFFDQVANALKVQHGLHWTWQQVQGALQAYTGDNNVEFFQTSSSILDVSKAKWLVTAAANQFIANKAEYLHENPNQPTVRIGIYQPLNTQQIRISKPIGDLATRLIAGVILAVVLAFIWEYFDEYVRDSHDVERILHTQALAIIPGKHVYLGVARK